MADRSNDAPDETPGRRLPWLALSLVGLAFLPVMGFGFVRWDDPLHLLENPLVLEPSKHGLGEHLLTPGLGYPTPLTVLTYRLEFALVGLRVPALFHATNLGLHLLACALLHRFARGLGLGPRASAFAILFFGLHPVVAEPVAWISGRKDLLALVFALGALVLALPRRGAPRHSWAALACFGLGLACKPVAAWVALVVPWVWEFTPDDPRSATARWRSGIRSTWPFMVLAALSVALAMHGQRAVGAVHQDRELIGLLREAWYALGHHLGLVFLLHEPCIKYLPPIFPPPFTARVDLFPLLGLPGLALSLRYLDVPRRRAAEVGLLVAAASYLPSSNLVPLVRYLADSYLYGSIAGLGLVVGALADRFLERVGSVRVDRAVFASVAVLGVLLLIPSELRFHDSVSLWEQAVARNPHDARLCQNLVVAHYDTDGPAGALAAADGCIARFGPAAFEKNRGVALFRLGRFAEAEAELTRARGRRPDDPVIRYYLDRIRSRSAD